MTKPGFDANLSSPEALSQISGRLLRDPTYFGAIGDQAFGTRSFAPGDQLIVGNPYKEVSGAKLPLLNDTIKQQLLGAKEFTLTSAEDNKLSIEKPDYRLTVGKDGKLQLEKVGDGDPLKDGKLNVEIDTNNKSLTEAIKQADKNLKEYIREMSVMWQQNHPGEQVPEWMQHILNMQPNIPADAQPVPIRPAQPETQPQPEPQPQPQPEQPAPQSRPPESTSGGSSGGSGGGSGGGDGGGSSGGSGGGSGGGSSSGSGDSGAAPGSSSGAASADKLANVRTIVEVAKEHHIDPALAVATALQETGGNLDNKAVGDGGHSIGLFQLNDQGEGSGMSVAEREDPRRNAEVALGTMETYINQGKVTDQNGDGQITGGDIAVSAQRPSESVRSGYVANVDGHWMQEAKDLIAQSEKPAATAASA